MFLRDKAIHAPEDQFPDLSSFIQDVFEDFLRSSGLCAGFLCLWNADMDITPVVAHGVPLEPFKGGKKDFLTEYIGECLKYHPAPHAHSIAKHKLWSSITSIVDAKDWQPKAIFLPAFTGDLEFVFICFSNSVSALEITSEMIDNASYVVHTAGFILSANDLRNRVKVMEIYVREIGHDIASSVQAIISKLRNVSRGLIQGPAAIAKIKEAEEEIMATYRVADTLGITVDPDYNIGGGDNFDPETVVREVVKQCSSEAAERHIELRIEPPENKVELWGDHKAVQSAITQLLMNAIKYAKGSSFVTIRINEAPSTVQVSITDYGIPLSKEDEFHIWEFGWRGEKAKELHVNGSGIGLYTVKKIVNAHGGGVSVRASGQNNDVVTFSFRIPKKNLMKKYPTGLKMI